jgi:hypothetical protein
MERIKGLSEVKVLKIKEAAAKMMVTWTRISDTVHQLIFLVAGCERLCDCHWLGGQTQAMYEDKHRKQAA